MSGSAPDEIAAVDCLLDQHHLLLCKPPGGRHPPEKLTGPDSKEVATAIERLGREAAERAAGTGGPVGARTTQVGSSAEPADGDAASLLRSCIRSRTMSPFSLVAAGDSLELPEEERRDLRGVA